MTLDLNKITPQIEGMVQKLAQGSETRRRHLELALSILRDQSHNIDALKRKIDASRTTWLVATLVNGLDRRFQALPTPEEFTIIATDGSHIDVDRHRRARCYLINIGAVSLTYGNNPSVTLDSFPHLYSQDEDLVIAPPQGTTGREQSVEGSLLGIKRSVAECQNLAELAKSLSFERPALALMDGSLILWGLGGSAIPEFVIKALLHEGFLSHMEKLREESAHKNLALASYVSFPRSTDVVNVLRVAICPHSPPDCDRYCVSTPSGERPCDGVAGIQDRELFSDLLHLGERSALFMSTSKISLERYGRHRVYFFYLKLEDEIARIEFPEWIALDETKLGLTHSLILDQCRRGQGYPVAISEAHEQAVIRTFDRENFWLMIESCLTGEGLPTFGSAKDFSKRTRWV